MEQDGKSMAQEESNRGNKEWNPERKDANLDNEALIKEIVQTEWAMFDRVSNAGGRAGCQDDWETFDIMRRSQFVVWDRVSLESYRNDLQQAEKQGRNLLTEKYAYMMQDTCPEEYQKIEKELPVLSAAFTLQSGAYWDKRPNIIQNVINNAVIFLSFFFITASVNSFLVSPSRILHDALS